MVNTEQNSADLQEVSEQPSDQVEESEIPEFHWDDPADEQHASEILNELFDTFFSPNLSLVKITAAAIEILGVQWKLTQLLSYIDTSEESLLNYHKVKRFVTIIRNVFLRSERYAGRIFHNLRSADSLNQLTGTASRQVLIVRVYDFLSEALSVYDRLSRDWEDWEEEKNRERIEQVRPPPYTENINEQNIAHQENELLNSPPRNSPPPYSHSENSVESNSDNSVPSRSSEMTDNGNNNNDVLAEAIQRLNQQLHNQRASAQQNQENVNRTQQQNQQTMQQLLQTQQAVADQMRNLTTSIQNMAMNSQGQGNGNDGSNGGINPTNDGFTLGVSNNQTGRVRSQSDPARLIEQSLQVSTEAHCAKQSLIEVLNKVSQSLVKMNKLAENSVLVFFIALLEKNALSVQSNIVKFIPDLVQKLSDYIANEQINAVTSSVFPVRVSQWISDAMMMAPQPQPFRGGARIGGGANSQISAANGNTGSQKICARFNELGYCDWVGNNGAACKFQHCCSNCHGNHGFKHCPANSANQGQRHNGFRHALQQNISQPIAAPAHGMGIPFSHQGNPSNQFSNFQHNNNGSSGFRL